MAELNLKQIADKLNKEFSGDSRKLVFWYDDAGEFAEDIDQIELENAKLYKLAVDNQFSTKYFLEREDQTTNYLIYAPFAKSAVRDNHLADTIKYSKEFFADRASLICIDLGIKEEYRPIIQKYIKFFAAKDRAEKFYQFELEKFNKTIIETAFMSILCKCRTSSFDEVVRAILMEANFQENKYMVEIEKFGLTDAFWRLCDEHFGYHEAAPSIKKLAIMFFITYTVHYMHSEPPKAWVSFVSFKSGTIIAFMDNVMNNIIYRDTYNEISEIISSDIKADQYFAGMELSSLPLNFSLNSLTFLYCSILIVDGLIEASQKYRNTCFPLFISSSISSSVPDSYSSVGVPKRVQNTATAASQSKTNCLFTKA